MNRREFLKSAIPAAALIQSGWGGLLLREEEVAASRPPLKVYDLVVVGGTLFGCFAAHHAARRGLHVLLIERRTFLGTEITATLRPWLRRRGYASFREDLKGLFLPEEEQSEVGVPFVPNDSAGLFGEDVPLFCGSVKKQFMATLLKEGVDVLLMTGVWGVLANEAQKTACGVALANKCGLQVAYFKNIIDTTGRKSSGSGNSRYDHSFTLEFYGVEDSVDRVISAPESLGLLRSQVCLHKGKRMPGQFFLEFAADRTSMTPQAASDLGLGIALKLHSVDDISFVPGKMGVRHREFSVV